MIHGGAFVAFYFHCVDSLLVSFNESSDVRWLLYVPLGLPLSSPVFCTQRNPDLSLILRIRSGGLLCFVCTRGAGWGKEHME